MKLIKGHQYFEAQEKGEEVILIVRMHWLTLIAPLIIGPVVTFFLSITAFFAAQNTSIFSDVATTELIKVVTVSVILLFGALYTFSSWLSRYFNVIILTNKHLVDVTQLALFSRKVSTLALESIEDVAIEKRGFLSNVFDFGDIFIQTAGELPNFKLDNIGDPEGVQKAIMEARQKYSSGHNHRPS